MANLDDTFTFTINVYDWDGNPSTKYSTTKTLQHNDTEIIIDIPEGFKYSISEPDTDYTENYKIEDTNGTILNQGTSNQFSNQTLNEDQIVTFTNSKDSSPTTGIEVDSKPYALITIITIITGIIFIKLMKSSKRLKYIGKRFK